jgi:hypothetical protein
MINESGQEAKTSTAAPERVLATAQPRREGHRSDPNPLECLHRRSSRTDVGGAKPHRPWRRTAFLGNVDLPSILALVAAPVVAVAPELRPEAAERDVL